MCVYVCVCEVLVYVHRLRGVCVRVLELFVRHVCLLRPLREGGKMRVTTDMAQVELIYMALKLVDIECFHHLGCLITLHVYTRNILKIYLVAW